MKKLLMGWMALGLAFAVSAANEETVTVTGNRVSLRAAPDINAVLLDRAMSGDELVLANNSNADWVGVQPPDSIDLWVAREFLSGGQVVPLKLNVRSGPSLSHSVVGVVTNGTKLIVRGTVDGWARIAPPATTTVWVSRRYVDAPELPTESIVLEIEQTEPEKVRKKITQYSDGNVVIESMTEPVVPAELVPDPDKPQGVEKEYRGVLRFASGKLYKLVDPDAGWKVLCFVRGNEAQMKELKGKNVTLTGQAYWAKGLSVPVVKPVTIGVPRRSGQLRQPDQSRL